MMNDAVQLEYTLPIPIGVATPPIWTTYSNGVGELYLARVYLRGRDYEKVQECMAKAHKILSGIKVALR